MANNETIVNSNTIDDKIIKDLEFMAVDLDDPKNNDIKSYCDGDNDEIRWNDLIGNNWVIYSNGYDYEKKPIMIRNGVRIIKWIWRMLMDWRRCWMLRLINSVSTHCNL